jgi:hypothetical protein
MDLMPYLLQKLLGYINTMVPTVPIHALEFKEEPFHKQKQLVKDITV